MHILLSYKYCSFARIMIPCPCLWKYLTYSICFSPSLNSLFAYLTLPFILHYQCDKAVPVIIASTFASVILRCKWSPSFPIYYTFIAFEGISCEICCLRMVVIIVLALHFQKGHFSHALKIRNELLLMDLITAWNFGSCCGRCSLEDPGSRHPCQ